MKGADELLMGAVRVHVLVVLGGVLVALGTALLLAVLVLGSEAL